MKDYFEGIIGYEEIINQLKVISDMLKNSDIYRKLGVDMTDGVILSGDPGLGKTTMAECFIKSTGRSSFTCRKKESDGEFLKKIGETFNKAEKNAPSIVLLDDIDKFSTPDKAGDDAEEFVAVQACIDEVRGKDVFVIATANKLYKLPESLLRHGRLGTEITLRHPDPKESKGIIRKYLSNAAIGPDVDPDVIGDVMNGESCAALEMVVKAAGMKAAFKRQDFISMKDLIDACLDVQLGSVAMKPFNHEITKRTAYHEASHAVVSEVLQPGNIMMISIRPGMSDNFGFAKYAREYQGESFDSMKREILIALAGKASSELFVGDPDVGANEDLQIAFNLLTFMVNKNCLYGFHNWDDGSNLLDLSAENRHLVVTSIMETYYLEAKRLLVLNRDMVDAIAMALIEKTTLVYPEIREIIAKVKKERNGHAA